MKAAATRAAPIGVAGLWTKILERFSECQLGAAARQPREKRAQHVGRLVAHREYLAGFLDLGGNPFGLEQLDALLDAQRGQRRVQKSPGRAEGLDDAAIVGGLGDVAARAAGHQDFDARPAVLLEDQGATAAFRGPDARHQPGRPGADHDDLPAFRGSLSGRIVLHDSQVAEWMLHWRAGLIMVTHDAAHLPGHGLLDTAFSIAYIATTRVIGCAAGLLTRSAALRENPSLLAPG